MLIQRIVTIINLVLITALAYFAVNLFYGLAGSQIQVLPEKNGIQVKHTAQADTSQKPLSHYQPIVDKDLFKTKTAAPAPKQEEASLDLESLQETQLKLKLWGTVSGSPESAYAVIEDTQKREQNLYRIGDVLQEATVKAILREKVILAVAGADEILTMEEARLTTAGGKLPQSRAITPRAFNPANDDGASRAQRISLNRSMIDDAMQDVTKLMTEIAITPHVGDDGQQAGLALNNIKPNSIFRRMGLRNGDVLVGVDGQEIQSVDDALRLYDNLKSSSGVKLQIMRRGQERTIDYMIR